MAGFDAESYLRRLGERLLGDAEFQDDGRLLPLRGATGALVMAGLLDADDGWRVIDDYRSAINIRSGQPRFLHFPAPSRRGAATQLMPRQTMVIDHEIAVGQNRVRLRDLAITDGGAVLRYRRYHGIRAPRELARRYPPGGSPWTATPPEIVDSAGNRPMVRRGDGGSDARDHSDGEWELSGTIARDAKWLQIDGTEVGLNRHVAGSRVRLDALPAEDPVKRYLWRVLAVADPQSGRTVDVEPAIQALLAAGVLRERSRLVKDLRAVAARLPDHPLYQAARSVGSVGSLVNPWGPLLRRLGRRDGPEWTRVIDAIAPSCDGVQVAVHWISSDLAGFEIEFEVTPHVLGAVALDELPAAWWAVDDRHNHYLGVPIGWSVSDTGALGTMRYWPALDPRAAQLDLLMQVDSHQAVVSVSLDTDGTGSQ